MSYSILYRSMFVKMNDGRFIPMIECGDNNVYDLNNKRTRSWTNDGSLTKGKFFLTQQEIMQGVEKYISSVKDSYVNKPKPEYDGGQGYYTCAEVERRLGWFAAVAVGNSNCSSTTAKRYRNFYFNGIRRAVSINDIRLDVHWCTEWPHYEHRYTSTEEELFAAIKEGQESGHQVWIGFADTWKADRLYEQNKAATTVKRQKIERTKGYVVTIIGNYIVRTTSRKFYHNPYLDQAHVYATKNVAERIKSRIARNNYSSEIFEVEKIGGEWRLTSQTAEAV